MEQNNTEKLTLRGVVENVVYQNRDSKVEDLLQKDRVDFIYPADYSEGTGLDLTVKNIIRKMAVCDILERENSRQKRDIQTR